MAIEQWILTGCIVVLVLVFAMARAMRKTIEVIDGKSEFVITEQLQRMSIRQIEFQSWCSFTICTCSQNGKRDTNSHSENCNYTKFCGLIENHAAHVIAGDDYDVEKFNRDLFMAAAGRRVK